MNKNTKLIIGLAIIILLGLFFYISEKKSDQDKVDTIKVGIIAPLTGPLSEYGEAFKNGVILAREENPNTNLNFIFEDSAEDPKVAISAFYKLRDQDKVNLIFNWGAASSQAIAPLVEKSNIVFLSNSSEPEITKNSKYVVRTAYKAEDYASTMWSYFRSKGYKNIAIIKLDIVFFNELLRGLTVTKNSNETVTVLDNYLSFGDRDFKTSILKLIQRTSEYDALGVFLVQGQVAQFYTQANLYGLKLPTFGTDVFESQSELINAGKYMNGATYALNDFSLKFKNTYRERFSNIGQISYAANAYDISKMLMSGIDFRDRDTIITSIKKEQYSGVAGTYKFSESSEDRSFSSPVVLKTITNGDLNPGN